MNKKELEDDLKHWMFIGTVATILWISFLVLLVWQNADYTRLQVNYYNYRADKACQEQQYATVGLMNVTEIVPVPKIVANSSCGNVTCDVDLEGNILNCSCTNIEYDYYNITIQKTSLVYRNFTTGRYIDGKIECQEESNRPCYRACAVGYPCDEGPVPCPPQLIEIINQQNFTLQELEIQ